MFRQFYGTAYAPDGSKLHEAEAGNSWKENQYWNDACCMPQDATGLTFLDVGCSEGNHPLRFAQRGGTGIGLNFHPNGAIIAQDDSYPNTGLESDAERYLQLKELWPDQDFEVFIGGFTDAGIIVPDTIPQFNIVACLNVLEYILSPKQAVASLFSKATDRVLIATDVVHKGNTGPSSIEPIMRNLHRMGELVSFSPWPCVFWQHSVPCDGREWPQLFMCATNPDSTLAPVDPSEVSYDTNMEHTETQKYWMAKNKVA